ncbi:MAG: eukaryotic-like serine/threonine-protein kinase [Pseudonocardiales bacterium]|nr:eukaryotic-like serine/threonine-protein kinase [Pseudonocardiales bacterium]
MTGSEDVLIAGRYRLVTALASGGMGVVWKGWDERLKRPVAVKQLRVQPGLSPAEATTARDRAMREARNTARLHHPHAVPVYDVVEHDGDPCLIMQFLPSISLQEAIHQRGTLPLAQVARIGNELAEALTAAHRVGIVHRDVKPGNVLLAEDGTAKLTDFGISHALGDATLTATGMITGTPAYLAPEVARGQPASFASDVFSLGATLYTAAEGTPPFGEGSNAMAVLHRVASGQVRPPQRSGSLTPVLMSMLTGDPGARPVMADVGTDLGHALSALPTGNSAAQVPTSVHTARYPVPSSPPVRTPARFAGSPSPPVRAAAPHSTLPNIRPVGPPSGPRRRRGPIAAIVAGVLAVAAVAIFALTRPGPENGSPSGSAGSKTTSSAPQTPTRAATTSRAPTAQQLAQAVTDYYALMPENIQAGWARLTPSYQQAGAGGLNGYEQFWGQFAKVTVSNATGQLPDSAQATITYTFKNGQTSTERRNFQLILSSGTYKINASAVLG